MKKNIIIPLFLSFLCLILLMGCTKVIDTEYKEVKVKIVDEYYKSSDTKIEYNVALKMPMAKTIPAVHRITVEYNDVQYMISDSDTYNKYKDKIGQTTTGILEINSYDDGSVKYNITALK